MWLARRCKFQNIDYFLEFEYDIQAQFVNKFSSGCCLFQSDTQNEFVSDWTLHTERRRSVITTTF
jgi:hypothetical protein